MLFFYVIWYFYGGKKGCRLYDRRLKMQINGEIKNGYAGETLEDMLLKEGYEKKRIATEINGCIIPKSEYAQTILKEEDTIEIVNFVGGGSR